jgi:small-conductance mechanosensitive channel
MDPDNFQDALATVVTVIRVTLRSELSSIWLPIQFGTIAFAAIAAVGVSALVRRRFDLAAATMGWPGYLRLATRALIENFAVLVFILLIFVLRAGLEASMEHARTYLLGVATNLATAWVVIAILASLIRNHFINRIVAVTAWTIAALSIMGLLDGAVAALDSRAIVLGGLRISPLLLLKLTALLLLAIWIATAVSNFLDRRVQASEDLTPSVQVLLGKLIRIAVMAIAIIVVLSMSGIDLSVFAIATGAVGVGVGLGLQKIVANFVSGIVLLADKSIKPGDVITIGEHFGWVTNMGTRYTSVDLKDGREVLVPNEDLVTQRVINWSYTSDRMQLQIRFNTSYGDDIKKTQAAAVEAALSVPQVMKEPVPSCHITAFGASALEFVLWAWIKSASEGPTRVRSAVMIAMWDAFEKQGIVIPKPSPTRVILEQPPQAS